MFGEQRPWSRWRLGLKSETELAVPLVWRARGAALGAGPLAEKGLFLQAPHIGNAPSRAVVRRVCLPFALPERAAGPGDKWE